MVAQWLERLTGDQQVAGSIPVWSRWLERSPEIRRLRVRVWENTELANKVMRDKVRSIEYINSNFYQFVVRSSLKVDSSKGDPSPRKR